MKSDNQMPSTNVVPFPRPGDGSSSMADRDAGGGDANGFDQGPTPEESLRLMRAFVGIKNRMLRADLINMLEGAARARPEPARGKE